MKRTTVTLPAKLLENLVEATHAKSRSQAVIIAIEEQIKRKKWNKLKETAGNLEFLEADQIRHDDHRTG